MTTDAHPRPDDADTLDLEVGALSHGPDAVARVGGRVIFVPRVAPGDRVRARIVDERGSYARATVLERTASGSAYREPPCPWAGTCGGCPWQQVTYPAQLAAKERNVREALARIAHLAPRRALPIIAAPAEWEYRQRIRLHCGSGARLGYMRPRSHEVVEIDACLVAAPPLSAALQPVRSLVATLGTRVRTVELLLNGRGGVAVRATAEGPFRPRDDAVIQHVLGTTPALTGLELVGPRWQRRFGDPRIAVVVEPGTPPLLQQPGSFSQVNPEANRLLVATVLAMAEPARRVLDLFCGAGNLSLPLARAGAEVVGVDRDAGAIDDARAAARVSRLASTRFDVAPADRFLRQQGATGADLVVLDPPRTGAATTVAQLGRLRPPRILYVSCDPATLARDVRTLAHAGYGVDRVQPIDLFPHSEHVETVLEAVRQ